MILRQHLHAEPTIAAFYLLGYAGMGRGHVTGRRSAEAAGAEHLGLRPSPARME